MQPGNQISIPDKIIAIANTLPEGKLEELRNELTALINELINNDFHSLVQLLYRIDVDEKKLKELLKSNTGVDSASIIADLVISRQLQKIATKKQFRDGEEPGAAEGW